MTENQESPAERVTPDRVATVGPEDFEAQVGQSFRFRSLDGQTSFEGKILRVRRLARHYEKATRLPFAVEVALDGRQYFAQSTVRFENDALGAMELFAVPIGPVPGAGMGYELIFT